MAHPASLSTKDRVRKHREALRANGLRPVTRWVPDTRTPDFIADYRAQIERLSAQPEGDEFWKWADGVQCTEGWI